MSFAAYVSDNAWSIIASSSGVNPPSIILINPTKLIILERKTSSTLSSSLGSGKSNGLMWLSELKDILKNDPSTDSESVLNSFSGSIIIHSVPIIKERRISNLTAYDLPDPDLAKITILAFSILKRSNKTSELLCLFIP